MLLKILFPAAIFSIPAVAVFAYNQPWWAFPLTYFSTGFLIALIAGPGPRFSSIKLAILWLPVLWNDRVGNWV